jgi:hypothetical protein
LYGGFIWFEGDCIAQKILSPPKVPSFRRLIIQPKELETAFKLRSMRPPENDLKSK